MPARLRPAVDALQVTAVARGAAQPAAGRHRGAAGDRRRGARAGGAAVRLRRAATGRARTTRRGPAAPGRAAPPGHLGRPLVPRRLGPGPRRLAHLPRRPHDPAHADRARGSRPRELPAPDVATFVAERFGRPAGRAGARSICTRRRPRSPLGAAGRRSSRTLGPRPLPGRRRLVVVDRAGRLGRDVRRRRGASSARRSCVTPAATLAARFARAAAG